MSGNILEEILICVCSNTSQCMSLRYVSQNSNLSLLLFPQSGLDQASWGKLLVSVTVQIITMAGGADSDPWGSLSEPLLSSRLSLSFSLCVYLSSWKRSLVAAVRGLCYAPCQAHAVQCIHAN